MKKIVKPYDVQGSPEQTAEVDAAMQSASKMKFAQPLHFVFSPRQNMLQLAQAAAPDFDLPDIKNIRCLYAPDTGTIYLPNDLPPGHGKHPPGYTILQMVSAIYNDQQRLSDDPAFQKAAYPEHHKVSQLAAKHSSASATAGESLALFHHSDLSNAALKHRAPQTWDYLDKHFNEKNKA